jgi:hypothetical protein
MAAPGNKDAASAAARTVRLPFQVSAVIPRMLSVRPGAYKSKDVIIE